MFPLNLAADLGGGGAILAFGIAAVLFERGSSGRGQVIDGAMVDGVAGQLSLPLAHLAMDRLGPAGTNFNDTGSHFYEVYETSDGGHLAIGAIEPKFYAAVLAGLGLADRTDLPGQNDASGWPMMKDLFAEIIGARTLAAWTELFAGVEACVSPVLELEDALTDEHLLERGTYVELDGIVQPGVALRFSRTPGAIGRPAPATGEHTDEVLRQLGCSPTEIESLRRDAIVS